MPDNDWTKYWKEMQAKRKLMLQWKMARPTLSALGLHINPGHATKLRYFLLPEQTFYSLWAYQNQKALKKFVKDTQGDEFYEHDIMNAANYLWYKEPKTVEDNLN